MRKNKQRGKRLGQNGSAMLTVLCVLTVILLLSLSLYSALKVLYVTQKNSRFRMQARAMAVSCLDCLEGELLCARTEAEFGSETEASEPEDGEQEQAEVRSEAEPGLNTYLEQYGKYWEGKRTFQADTGDGGWPREAGNLTVSLSWEYAEDDAYPAGHYPETDDVVVVLCVEVNAVVDRQSCKISRTYAEKPAGGWERWERE